LKTIKGGHAMAIARGKCSACGALLELAIADTLAGAALAAALCPGCTDQQFLDEGGAVLQLRQEPEGARFPLGKVTITGGAVEALADAGQHAVSFLARHARGDWGETGHFDQIVLTDDEHRRGWEATDDPGQDQQEQCPQPPGPDQERVHDRTWQAALDHHHLGRHRGVPGAEGGGRSGASSPLWGTGGEPASQP
jgi:hypothetical protein